MKIVFFGSSEFAVPSLDIIVKAGQRVLCVVTQPDRLKGRGLHIEPTALKQKALQERLKLFQPPDINSDSAAKFLKTLNADLFVVIAYGQILSPEILKIPRLFSINVHASLLPRYRGAAPMNWSLINGDKESGITIIKINEKMDAGQIILKEREAILENDDIVSLEAKLAQKGAVCLAKSIGMIENNTYALIEQEEDKADYAPKLHKKDGLVNWGKAAQEINNLVRGCLVWPGAFTYYNGRLLKIYKTKVTDYESEGKCEPGEIIAVSKDGITAACGRGSLLIEELQIEGRKKMAIGEFIAGHRIKAGERFVPQPQP